MDQKEYTTRKRIPVVIILLTIIVFLFLLVFIASKSLESSPSKKSIKKTIIPNESSMEILKPISLSKNEDALVFETKAIDDNTLYICAGNFDDSSLSIWEDGKLVYNQIYKGVYGFVFYKNRSIVNQGFYKVFDVYSDQITKNIGIDLTKISNKSLENLMISVNNSNCKVYIYSLNKNNENSIKSKTLNTITQYEIKEENNLEHIILQDYDFSEFGIVNYIKSNNLGKNFLKIKPERRTNEWYYTLNPGKKYLLAYMKNLYNLEITIKSSLDNKEINVRKNNETKILEKEFIVESNEIIIKNKDEELKIQNMNSDFIDAFYTPLYMYNQFVYGKEKKIVESKNKINYKVCVFEI